MSDDGVPLTPAEAESAYAAGIERSWKADINRINDVIRGTPTKEYPKRFFVGGNAPYALVATIALDGMHRYIVLDRPKTAPGGPYR